MATIETGQINGVTYVHVDMSATEFASFVTDPLGFLAGVSGSQVLLDAVNPTASISFDILTYNPQTVSGSPNLCEATRPPFSLNVPGDVCVCVSIPELEATNRFKVYIQMTP